jgi:hypothetical protein
VLADMLRTDRARLMPLTRHSDATIALRRTCRAGKDLVAHRVAVTNQLRAHLQNVFPSGRAVRRPGLPDQLGLFGPFRLPRPRGLAVGETSLRLAGLGGLQRRGPSRPAAFPASGRPARRHRQSRRRSDPHHRGVADCADHADRADQGPNGADQPAARRARRPADLHQPAPQLERSGPPGCWPKSGTAADASPPPTR